MKRHPALKHLSWEHHATLVVASRIEKGLNNGTDPATVAAYALRFWERWLFRHFRSEEQMLEEQMARHEELTALLRRLRDEHHAFEAVVERLWGAGDALPQALATFAALLRVHIRFEERELFPAVETTFPAELLERIGAALHAEYEPPDTGWETSFWR